MTVARDPVARAIDVLTWIADHPGDPISVRQVARDIGTSPATVFRVLQTFHDRALIGRDGAGFYTPGLELHRICAGIARELSPARIARPHLEALSRESGEATLLGVYDARRRKMLFVDKIEAPHPLRYVVELNQWLPVHAGATGLAIFAFLPVQERRRIYADGLWALTPATLNTAVALEAVSATVREQGYAHSSGQRTSGAVGFAAPVFDSDDRVCGDICITLPGQRFDPETGGRRFPAQLIEHAARVTAELKAAGYRAVRPQPEAAAEALGA